MPEVQICGPDHGHGVNMTCYSHGCRCDECREWAVEAQYFYRAMKRAGRYQPPVRYSTVGFVRRFQALGALGWSGSEIAKRFGVAGSRIRQMVAAPQVGQENFDRMCRVYDELWSTPAPRTYASTRVRNRAARDGWAPPLAWDDETIDDPTALPVIEADEPEKWADRFDDANVQAAIDGLRPHLAPMERREAVRRLYRRFWSDVRIANWIGGEPRQIGRIRDDLGLPAWEHYQLEESA